MSRCVLFSLAVRGLAGHRSARSVCISLLVQGEGGRKEVMLFPQSIDAVESKVTLKAQEITSSICAYCFAFHLVHSIATAAAQPLLTELIFLQLLQVKLPSSVIVFCQDMVRAWMQLAAALLCWNLKSTFINET